MENSDCNKLKELRLKKKLIEQILKIFKEKLSNNAKTELTLLIINLDYEIQTIDDYCNHIMNEKKFDKIVAVRSPVTPNRRVTFKRQRQRQRTRQRQRQRQRTRGRTRI
jgi:hypothetical protein